MSDEIKIAIVGCGGMASYHLKQYGEIKKRGIVDFEIVAVCDVVEERMKKFSKTIEEFQGTKPMEVLDSNKLLEIKDLDAVDIATDHRTHHTLSIPFLRNGIHALVEKPLAITMRAAHNMIEAAEDGKAILAVAENYRRSLNNRSIGWTIQNGHIGKLQMIFLGGVGGAPNWGRDAVIAGTPWRHEKLSAGAGPVLDNGVHDADLFRYFAGDVSEAIGVTRTFEGERYLRDEKGTILRSVKNTVEDAGFAILNHENGCVTLWAPAYWAGHGEGSSFGKWIYGSKGVIKEENLVLDSGFRMNVTSFFLLNASQQEKEKYFPHGLYDSVAIELYDFLTAVRDKKKPETSAIEGYKAMAISYSVIESSYLKKPVNVKDVEELKIENYQKEINEKLGIK
ncbi:MAG: Gfo/Idh/MocA family protein [Thermoproteota archaeon]|jgi:predicted dehydrogenase